MNVFKLSFFFSPVTQQTVSLSFFETSRVYVELVSIVTVNVPFLPLMEDFVTERQCVLSS